METSLKNRHRGGSQPPLYSALSSSISTCAAWKQAPKLHLPPKRRMIFE